MKRLLIPALMLMIGIAFMACKENPKGVDAMVVGMFQIDDCNAYMIDINGKLFKPEHLSKEFEVDSLKVSITYTVIDGVTHNCGFGGYKPVIKINSISKR